MAFEPDKPLFESSQTGSKVYKLEGEPQFLHFVTFPNENPKNFMIDLPATLEIFKLINAIWYGGLWRELNICIAAQCIHVNEIGQCHNRIDSCPTLTEYEGRLFDDYNRRVRELHMEAKRAPIAPKRASDSPRESAES